MPSGSAPTSHRRFVLRRQHLHERPPAFDERRIQEAHQRRDGAENPQELRIETRRGGKLRFELAACEKLLEPQVVRRGVLSCVSPRHGGEPVAV
jgi:hypothetical protein